MITAARSEHALFNETAELSQGVIGAIQYVPFSGPTYERFLNRWHSLDPIEYPSAGPDTFPTSFVMLQYDMFITACIALDILDKSGELEQQRIPPETWVDTIRGIEFEGVSGFVSFDDYFNDCFHSLRTPALTNPGFVGASCSPSTP